MLQRLSVTLLLLMLSLAASAVVDVYEFDNDVDRRRYQSFTEELRCPKCQNQNLAGSNSPISEDLRRELHRLIVSGQSDKEIIDFMVSRYGDYVLYRPQLQGATWVLWYGPAVMLLVGVIALLLILRRRSRQPIAAEPPKETDSPLSSNQREQLDALLNKDRDQNS